MTTTKLKTEVQGNTVLIGPLRFTLERTLRVPQDGKVYPLPASLGSFPVYRVDDYLESVPAHWRAHGGVFVPLWQREAMWINFLGTDGQPVAVKVAAGKVCAVTGFTWTEGLGGDPQDYMVTGQPGGQRWLDGFKTGDGHVSQFVAMALGGGYTAEAQLTGREDVGGIQLKIFEVKADRRLQPQPRWVPNAGLPKGLIGSGIFGASGGGGTYSCNVSAVPQQQAFCAHMSTSPMNFLRGAEPPAGMEMGLAPGGTIEQAILDAGEWTPDAFDMKRSGRVFIHIVNSAMFKAITGMDAPATPITAEAYRLHKMPWFSTYAEDAGRDVAPTPAMEGLKSINEIDAMKGVVPPSDATQGPLVKDVTPVKKVRDGNW